MTRISLSGSSGESPSTEMEPRPGWINPVIRFIKVVFPLPLGPTRLVMPRWNVQRDFIDSENLSIELGDVFEDDLRTCHEITSTGRSFRSRIKQSTPASATIIDTPLPHARPRRRFDAHHDGTR